MILCQSLFTLIGKLNVDTITRGIGHGVGSVFLGERKGRDGLEVLFDAGARGSVGFGQGSQSGFGGGGPNEVGEERKGEDGHSEKSMFKIEFETKHEARDFVLILYKYTISQYIQRALTDFYISSSLDNTTGSR